MNRKQQVKQQESVTNTEIKNAKFTATSSGEDHESGWGLEKKRPI